MIKQPYMPPTGGRPGPTAARQTMNPGGQPLPQQANPMARQAMMAQALRGGPAPNPMAMQRANPNAAFQGRMPTAVPPGGPMPTPAPSPTMQVLPQPTPMAAPQMPTAMPMPGPATPMPPQAPAMPMPNRGPMAGPMAQPGMPVRGMR